MCVGISEKVSNDFSKRRFWSMIYFKIENESRNLNIKSAMGGKDEREFLIVFKRHSCLVITVSFT